MKVFAWHRLPTESSKAYEAAKTYFEMGVERSLEGVGKKLGKTRQALDGWSTKFNWVERAQAYDDHQDAIRRNALEKAEQKEAEKWAERRLALREQEWELAEKLTDRLQQMLAFPVYQRITSEDGKTIFEPAKWTFRDASRLAEVTAKLFRNAAGLPVETSRQELTGADGNAIEITDARERLLSKLDSLSARREGEVLGESDE